MSSARAFAIVFVLSLGGAFANQSTARTKCSVEALPELPDVRLLSVSYTAVPVPHCRVNGVVGTETNFELLLPEAWNRKFVMGGGGGFVGSIRNTSLRFGSLQKGYATVGTDTGHQAHSLDARWALDNLERIVSFGHQAVHRTAVTAKALTAAHYGERVSRSYFTGCSRGGGQALMSAQRYPEDFDGIVAQAPAFNWTVELGARNTRLNAAMFPDPNDLSRAVIGPESQTLIGNAVMAQCDALDSVEDDIINYPPQCHFDVSTLACANTSTDECLSESELRAARAIYDDLYIGGKRVFPGFPVGAELIPTGWTLWLTGGLVGQRDQMEFQEGATTRSDFDAPVTPSAHFAFGNGVMKYLVHNDPDWSYVDYDFTNFWPAAARVAPTLDATNPDLSAFRARGGKLLIDNGWQDMALTAYGTIEYYESVMAHDPSAAKDVRLFVKPGVAHCAGGTGPDWIDYLDVIDTWVETGVAPSRLTAVWLDDQGQPTGSRPVCAYPKIVTYEGRGDPRDAANFHCAEFKPQ